MMGTNAEAVSNDVAGVKHSQNHCGCNKHEINLRLKRILVQLLVFSKHAELTGPHIAEVASTCDPDSITLLRHVRYISKLRVKGQNGVQTVHQSYMNMHTIV